MCWLSQQLICNWSGGGWWSCSEISEWAERHGTAMASILDGISSGLASWREGNCCGWNQQEQGFQGQQCQLWGTSAKGRLCCCLWAILWLRGSRIQKMLRNDGGVQLAGLLALYYSNAFKILLNGVPHGRRVPQLCVLAFTIWKGLNGWQLGGFDVWSSVRKATEFTWKREEWLYKSINKSKHTSVYRGYADCIWYHSWAHR